MNNNAITRAALALVIAGVPSVAMGQRNVVGVGTTWVGDKWFALEFGRELRADKHRLGLRIYADYSRQDRSGPTYVFFPSDTALLVGTRRPTVSRQQRRTAGIWLSASYTPFRWRLAPYLTSSVGLLDNYWSSQMPALDSATVDGVSWPSVPATTGVATWTGPAFRVGPGIAARIGRLRLFGETRLSVWPRKYDQRWSLEWRDPRLTFGVRF